jgi:DNA-binding NtrC family response regulator
MAKILVIDDDQGVRRLFDIFFRAKGYDVLLAESGRRGLELFRQDYPDIIVLDLNMRGTDGVAVLQHVRSLKRDQRVIMFTGACDPTTAQRIHAIGITEIVNKGSSLQALEEALKRALESPIAAAAIETDLEAMV